jgi:hypothetical protein
VDEREREREREIKLAREIENWFVRGEKDMAS